MTFRVEPTFQAKQDLFDILEWLLEEGAGDTGLRWFFKLEAAIASLSNMPQRCPLAPENENFPFEVRQLLYGRKPHRYRVLFTIDGDTVVILHIRHGRREHLRGNPRRAD
jgi:plasmid stabilization system protein ParE